MDYPQLKGMTDDFDAEEQMSGVLGFQTCPFRA